MPNALERLEAEIVAAVDNHRGDFGVTAAAAIGILEVVKARLLREVFEAENEMSRDDAD